MKPNNIMKIDYTDIIPMVALYDANSITEEKVKELIYSGEYDKKVIIITKEQFTIVFKDLINK
jgi:hypothetical protein